MAKKTTLVLHAAEARSDIESWLKKKGHKREYEKIMLIQKPTEDVWILEQLYLREKWVVDKLVLLGSFDRKELNKINDFIIFKGE